jgi:prefoldin subunit 5
MKQLIEKLNQELQEINQRKKDLGTAIQALQKICNHNFELAANTHKQREKCSECGEEISL